MKILQVINSLNAGGAEKLIAETSIRFNKKGLNVDVLVLNGTKTPLTRTIEESKKVNIISLGGYSNIYNPINAIKIAKVIKNYNIVHAHLFPALYWVAFAKLICSSKIKLIVTEHNTTNRRRNVVLFKYLERFVYKKFNKIITISDSVDESLKLHLNSKTDKIIKIYNGVDLKTIDSAVPYSKEELGFSKTDKLIIQVASFYPQKDQQTLIKAIQLLPNEYKLLLVGEGPLKSKLIELTNDLKLSNRIHFLGVRTDVPKLLKSIDIVVLSSHFEGLSLSSIEGLASGKPFICSDAPGLSEVVRNAGVMFEIGDFKKLSEIILELVSNQDYYNSIVKSCLERSQNYSINLMVDKYINLYNRFK